MLQGTVPRSFMGTGQCSHKHLPKDLCVHCGMLYTRVWPNGRQTELVLLQLKSTGRKITWCFRLVTSQGQTAASELPYLHGICCCLSSLISVLSGNTHYASSCQGKIQKCTLKRWPTSHYLKKLNYSKEENKQQFNWKHTILNPLLLFSAFINDAPTIRLRQWKEMFFPSVSRLWQWP